ncbi:DUF6493 family protein [Dactylosporangium sp. NPDC000244]|uniref:DUF6493 family protein n=1 Tax=Dactylosporangium sp. NPDC000244 TaxID=3154365 RepID=UPI00331B0207
MVTIDAMYARLRDSDDGVGILLADLWRLDPGPPPAGPPPARLRQQVAEVVGNIAVHWPQRAMFAGVRTLERLGQITLEHDETYVLAMISALGDRGEAEPRLAAIRADEELRESLLWRVFEVEGGGEVSLANVDKFSHPDAGWSTCLRTLAADGTLPRARLLDACLRALARDFSAYRAGFFSQLYTALAPAPAELDQARLLRLLASGVPATVSFAARHLVAADKAGGLDDPAFVGGAGAALTVPAKGTPLAVLALLDRIQARNPLLANDITAVVALGLEHRHREVQQRALALLRAAGATAEIAERVELLEPTVAREAADWLGASPSTVDQPSVAKPPGASPGTEPLAGPGTKPPGGSGTEQPAGPGTEPAAGPGPQRSVDERVAALLAGETDPFEIERFLADVAAGRVGRDLSGPARRVHRRGDDGSLGYAVAALVLGEPPKARGTLPAERIRELHRLAGPPRTLLATPTDASGWLDPAELVARLAAAPQPPHHDLVAALLRVHPGGRAGALRAAAGLPGEAGAAVRYALGGPPAPIGDRAVWIAAARSRAPLDDDPHLLAAGLGDPGQGRAVDIPLRVTEHRHTYRDGPYTRSVQWSEPDLRTCNGVADQPTVLAVRDWPGPGWIPWLAQTWPHDAEVFCGEALGEMLGAAGTERAYGASAVLDALAVHPGRLGPLAAGVLAAGLTATEIGPRTLAAEAFAAVVPPRRLDPALLAGAMVTLAHHATASRWSSALRASGAAPAVADVLSRALPRLPRDHPGLHALMATLHEESVRAGGVPVSPELRAWLAGFAGSSKAAKTARALLAEPA